MAATIRIRDETRQRLQELSAREQRPVSAIVEAAVQRYDDDTFWASYRGEMAELRSDPGVWARNEPDLVGWDGTLADGLAAAQQDGER